MGGVRFCILSSMPKVGQFKKKSPTVGTLYDGGGGRAGKGMFGSD